MSRLDALLSVFHKGQTGCPNAMPLGGPTSRHPQPQSAVVRLLPGHKPKSEIECHLYAALSQGPLPVDVLVDRVAERILHDEIRRGGWAVDIGLLGPDIYRPEISEMVRCLHGLMLYIEPEGGHHANQSSTGQTH